MKYLLTFAVIFLVSCASVEEKKKNAKLKLRILHTNDHHGHYLADKDGQYGMAARKTLIDKLRNEITEQKGEHLLLSGGDINTGTMESDIFDAEPDFKGMKALGYDAMAVGNHEFDNSFKVIQKQMKWAGFPFLSANIYWKGTDNRVFKPTYIIKELNGVKIGIFGLTTKDTPFKASHDDAKMKFDFRDITKVAKEVVKELKNKEKVDLVFVVTHVGHHGSTTSNGDIDLAKAVDDIDVIVGGHSQEIINAEVHNNTVIVQAEDWGKYVGVLDLYIDKSHERSVFDYKLVPVNLKNRVGNKKVLIENEILENPKMLKMFDPFKKRAEVIGRKVVGIISKTFDGTRTKVRSRQMPIGQFMAKSLAHQVSEVDIVVLNGGSMRASLNKGKVSRKDIHNVHPYGNTISTVKFSAKELFEYLKVVSKKAIVDPSNLIGGYPHIGQAALTIKNKELVKVEARDKSWRIELINGQLNSTRTHYTLGTMNFLAKGGDNYPKIVDHENYVDTGFMINSAMMNYVEANKNIKSDDFEKDLSEIIIFK